MLQTIEQSKDGTTKFIFDKGHHCVLIPSKNNKHTLCISSQHGCGMNCSFCLTAKMGFLSQLSTKEIVEQFTTALSHLTSLDEIAQKKNGNSRNYAKEYITSIVFMGMGEPLANYSNVKDAILQLHTDFFYPFKKITLSTCGILPQMKHLLTDLPQIHLALSFHSPHQTIRNALMPKVQQWKISELVTFCNDYLKQTKKPVMIEYLMIDGLTDRKEDLEQLLSLGFSKTTYFNLIPLNGSLEFQGKEYFASSLNTCLKFKEQLIEHGFKCFIRATMGDDIKAACGMLNSSESES
jgi:23S rRNA (adenine2503-C2)-methyltransferase